ncbi:MAG: type IV pilus modification PilV family protein [Planctomycetota bacterium]|jgi:prepilin-type N-terminal cleavage/methylation domain-containing protein
MMVEFDDTIEVRTVAPLTQRLISVRADRGALGFSLVEIMVVVTILAIGLAGILGTYFVMNRQNMVVNERLLARNALRAKSEEIRGSKGTPFYLYNVNNPNVVVPFYDTDGVIQRYSSRPPPDPFALWPVEPNQDDMTQFAVEGLLNPDQADQTMVGEIFFYLNETQVPTELGGGGGAMVEMFNGIAVGPRDLNNDEPADATYETEDHSAINGAQYRCELVPIEIRITWRSTFGTETESEFLLLPCTR